MTFNNNVTVNVKVTTFVCYFFKTKAVSWRAAFIATYVESTLYLYLRYIQDVSGRIVNILGDGSMDYSE
jgi:hypothetical protein